MFNQVNLHSTMDVNYVEPMERAASSMLNYYYNKQPHRGKNNGWCPHNTTL